MLRDDQLLARKCLLEGGHHGVVVEHRAGENHLFSQPSHLHHFGEVVVRDGVREAGSYDLNWHTFLLGGGDRLSHEGGTAGAQIDGVWSLKRQIGELAILNRDIKHLRQLIDEAARSGGARLVHLIINHHTISLDDQLRVLPADLDDVRLRVQFLRGPRLGGDLVLDQVGPDEAADQIPSGAGDAGACYRDVVPHLFPQIAEDLLDGFEGPSGGHEIILRDDGFAGLIEYHRFGTGRTNVYT